jgi:hypothetical protein
MDAVDDDLERQRVQQRQKRAEQPHEQDETEMRPKGTYLFQRPQ